MYKLKKAFTLAEVLITLAVIGIVSVMVLPTLIRNIQGKTMAAQIKNFSVIVQQLAGDQMVANRSNVLSVTDFSNPSALLSDDNFAITRLTEDIVLWDSDYTKISGSSISMKSSSKAGKSGSKSRVLKNGMLVNYRVDNTKTVAATGESTQGYFIVDVNGTDSPNIIGRDVFGFYITNKGRTVGMSELTEYKDTNMTTRCKNGEESACYSLLVQNNWEMNY